MAEYAFAERKQLSEGYANGRDIESILLANIPGSLSVRRAHHVDDRSGTDYWVEHERGRPLSVDCKVRFKDYRPRGAEYDDLALETWSVIHKRIPGWTRRQDKRTDYILWLWTDTGRWSLAPFPLLCRIFQENWQAWAGRYKTDTQHTPGADGGWDSECVFVPRKVVWREIYKHFG